ncbi:MAG: helix-turn-helix domain-containing protein [Thioploca sp.]|nr:helix-turn-helix domain-containing protein [Thioploca sp.]
MRKTIYSQQNQLLCKALKEMRERAGLTQRKLCRKLGREHSFISKCELGERRVDIIEFYWICKACGVCPEEETQKLMNTFAQLDSP